MITWLGCRMDDTVAESKFAALQEALTLLLNLSSGEQHFEKVRHVAPKSLHSDLNNQCSTHKETRNRGKNPELG